jgi:hypothetical protein
LRAGTATVQAKFPLHFARGAQTAINTLIDGETIVLTYDAFTERLRLMLYDLPNSRIVTIRNAAHGYSSPCLQNIAMDFIAAGSANGLDTACIATIRRPAFAR